MTDEEVLQAISYREIMPEVEFMIYDKRWNSMTF